jgi:hypothetical protein
MVLKSKRAAAAAAAATIATMLTASLFAAGPASAAQSAKITVAPVIVRHNCNPVVIVDRAPC